MPENFNPSNGELVAIIQRRPLVALRELAAEVWPALPWRAPEGPSTTGSTCHWGAIGNRSRVATPLRYLADRIEDLILRSLVRRGAQGGDRQGARTGEFQGGCAGGADGVKSGVSESDSEPTPIHQRRKNKKAH